jgi:very-short-patch-repair endonuclease
MMSRNPSLTTAARRSPLSRKGRELVEQPSPLAGEGGPLRSNGGRGGLSAEDFAKSQVKRLRKNMTEAETLLWQHLRGKRFENYKFRRQVALGRYIVDFLCPSARVIVEVDGSQHDDNAHDAMRDQWLQSQGFKVVRLWNYWVWQNIDEALAMVLDALREAPLSPSLARRSPLPRKGGELSKELLVVEPSPLAGEGGPLLSNGGRGFLDNNTDFKNDN